METKNQKWKFPLSVPKKGVFKKIKFFIGKATLILKPSLKEKFLKGKHPNTNIERMALATMVSTISKIGNNDEIAKIHRKLWESPDAFHFYSSTDNRFDMTFELVRNNLTFVFEQFFEMGINDRVVEIGCGTGKILDHLNKKYNFKKLIGIDINASQIKLNQSKFEDDPKFQFVAGDAISWIENYHGLKTVYFTFGGVFEYFTENELKGIFENIKKSTPSAIFIFEPLAKDFDPNNEKHSRIFGSEQSFSHPYTKFAKEFGMEIIENKIVENGNFRFLLLGAYFNSKSK
jgi:SAM-dependent methyltransferase